MSCLTLPPEKPCGITGRCTLVPNATFVCECDRGWSQTKEFSFWIDDESLDVCKYHEKTIQLLWILVCIFAFVTLALHIFSISKTVDNIIELTRKLKQGWPALTALLGAMIAGMYRWMRPEALWGHDFTFTFIVSNCTCLISISSYMQLIKASLRMVRKTEWTSSNVEKMIIAFKKSQPCLYVFDVAVTQLLWITCFVKREQGLLLVRSWEALSMLRDIHVALFTHMFLKQYMTDLEVVARYKGNLSIHDEIPSELFLWMRSHIKKAESFKSIVRLTMGFSVVYKLLPLVWDLVLSYWTWGAPLTLLAWTLLYLILIFIKYFSRQQKGQERSNARNNIIKSPGSDSVYTRNNFQKHLNANGEIERTRLSGGTTDSHMQGETDDEDELI